MGYLVGVIVQIVLLGILYKWFPNFGKQGYVRDILLLVISALVLFSSSRITYALSDPKPIVSLTHYDDELKVSITSKGLVQECDIFIPIGRAVLNIQSDNFVNNVEILKKCVKGPNTDGALNTVELVLKNLDGRRIPSEIEFTIQFNSNPPKMTFHASGGNENSRIVYYWTSNGESRTNEKWFDNYNGLECSGPATLSGQIIGGASVSLGAAAVKKAKRLGSKRFMSEYCF